MNKNFSEEEDWDELLELISDGQLTPIIGNELYKFTDQDKLVPIDNYLSMQLFAKYNITDQPASSLYKTVGYLKNEKKIEKMDIDQVLRSLAKKINFDFPLLAEFLTIRKLNYYINTTIYDTVFVESVSKVRKQKATSTNFLIKGKNENCDLEDLEIPFLFNVFGSLLNTVDPPTSEEEMLEYTVSFLEKIKDIPSIDNVLQNKNLLFIGCTYPDWQVRFILRLLSTQSFGDWGKERKMIIVNDKTEMRDTQYNFLKNYRVITYQGNTDDFVKELANRWNKKNPFQKNIFLSYTADDKPAVENLKNGLDGIENVTCFYDKDRINAGDSFDKEIADNIEKADLFISLISANSLTHTRGYIQKEWNWAEQESIRRKQDGNEKYLLPIIIDDTKTTDPTIPKCFSSISIGQLPQGNTDEKFLKLVKERLNL